MKHLKNARAIILIEILVATAILVISFVSFIYGFVNSSKLITLSKEKFYALHAANSKLEEMRGANFSNLYAVYSSSPKNFFTVPEIAQSAGSVSVDNSDPELIKVYIAVSWKSVDSRIIGEDINLSGTLEAGEDRDADGVIDSPVTLATSIARH